MNIFYLGIIVNIYLHIWFIARIDRLAGLLQYWWLTLMMMMMMVMLMMGIFFFLLFSFCKYRLSPALFFWCDCTSISMFFVYLLICCSGWQCRVITCPIAPSVSWKFQVRWTISHILLLHLRFIREHLCHNCTATPAPWAQLAIASWSQWLADHRRATF